MDTLTRTLVAHWSCRLMVRRMSDLMTKSNMPPKTAFRAASMSAASTRPSSDPSLSWGGSTSSDMLMPDMPYSLILSMTCCSFPPWRCFLSAAIMSISRSMADTRRAESHSWPAARPPSPLTPSPGGHWTAPRRLSARRKRRSCTMMTSAMPFGRPRSRPMSSPAATLSMSSNMSSKLTAAPTRNAMMLSATCRMSGDGWALSSSTS
mmetsp:Transcript_36643/g.104946  ORF Transcript_36643/g.104946 Transcript_36643/m.104946 type:complete len:207 (+) Transcript_36643:1622-2242(+)